MFKEINVYKIVFILLLVFCVFPPNLYSESVVSVKPILQVTEEYNDNIDLVDEDEESDFITIISPGIIISRETQKSQGELIYSPGFSFYADNSDYDEVRHNLDLNYDRELSKILTFRLRERLLRTEEPYTDYELSYERDDMRPSPETDTLTTREEREIRTSNVVDAELDFQFGPRNSWNLGYSFGQVWEDSEYGEDSTRHTANSALEYWFSPQWGTLLGASYTRGMFSSAGDFVEESDDFDEWLLGARLAHAFGKHFIGYIDYAHTAVFYDGDDEDFHVYDPGVGFEWIFGPEAYLNMRAGYYYRDIDQEENDDGVSLLVDIGKQWDITRRATFRLRGGSGYQNTYFGGENLGFTQYAEVEGVLSYALGRHTDANLSGAYKRNDYKDTDPDRTDDIYTIKGEIGYQVLEWLRLSLSDRYRVVESDIDYEEYKENSIMVSVSFMPQGWQW